MEFSSRRKEDPRSFKFLSVSSSDLRVPFTRFKDEKTDFRFRNEKTGSAFSVARSTSQTFTFDFSSGRNFVSSGTNAIPGTIIVVPSSQLCSAHYFKQDCSSSRNRSMTEVKFRFLLHFLPHTFAPLSHNSRLHSPRRHKVHRKRRRRSSLHFTRFSLLQALVPPENYRVDFIDAEFTIAYLEDPLLSVAKIFQPLASP